MSMKPEEPATEPTCERCGRLEGIAFGHRVLCAECLSEAGACCAEFDEPDEGGTSCK